MSYTMYMPLNVWLDPASVTDVVAYIQTYLSENTIYSEAEIETIIHDYLIAHPELIGGVQSVNGKTGTVVLSASDINTENNVTIESVLASLSSQISTIATNVATNTSNITNLTGRMATAETDLTNLKSNTDLNFINVLGESGAFNPSNTWYTSSASAYSVTDGVATFTATAQYGGIKTVNTIPLTNGHVYYTFGSLKGTNCLINYDGYGNATYITSDDFVFTSFVYTGLGTARRLAIITRQQSDFTPIYAKQLGVIDLTNVFGENIPSKERMDLIIKDIGYKTKYTAVDIIESFIRLFPTEFKQLEGKTIVLIGDSITETNYIINGELSPHKTNWPNFAAPILNNPTIYNLAQDGATYRNLTGQTQYQSFSGQYDYMVSKGYTPDIIIVALGKNERGFTDTETYDSTMAVSNKSDLDTSKLYPAIRKAFWDLKENYPNALIIAATQTQRGLVSQPDTVGLTIREMIIKMAKTYGIVVVDTYAESGIVTQFENYNASGRFLADGLHPNEAGKELLGKFWAYKLTQILTPNRW